jgi:hypothetical protein
MRYAKALKIIPEVTMSGTEEINFKLKSIDGTEFNPNNLSLEALVLLIKTEKLKELEEKSQKEFTEVRLRQKEVAELYEIIQALNTATAENGGFDCKKDDVLKQHLARAKELGVDMKEGKFSFNKDERDRLIENIRMTVDELNVDNDMQIQNITKLYNFRNEIIQFARSVFRPLHDAKASHARGARGG